MNLKDLFLTKLQVLYDIEDSIAKALPKMEHAANDSDLKNNFADHLKRTQDQVERLEKIFSILKEKPKKMEAEGIRGIIKDGEWVINNVEPEKARDANLARAAQYVEHYEMAGYIGAISWAKELGFDEIESILKETLSEEQDADMKLEDVALKLQKEVEK